MKKEYEIPNIEPFNDIFYKMCMYNPLLSGIYYLGGSVMPFLSNDFFTYYYYEDGDFRLRGKNIQTEPEFELIRDMGINIEYNLNSFNYKEYIKEAIDNCIPVFVPFDSYHNSSIAGTYNIRHWPHFFLVFGYNDLDNTFKVIDVDVYGYGCYKNKINCDELIKGYDSYCFHLKGELRMFKMHKDSQLINKYDSWKNNGYIMTFKDNFNKNSDEIAKGFANIKKVIELYESCISDPSSLLIGDQWNISRPFGYIETSKKVQMYQIYTFFGHEKQLMGWLEDIIVNYKVIKGLLLKDAISQVYREKTISSVVTRLTKVYQTELKYHDRLASILNDWREN